MPHTQGDVYAKTRGRGRKDPGRQLGEEHPTRGDGKVKGSAGETWPKCLRKSKEGGPAGAEQTKQRIEGGCVQWTGRVKPGCMGLVRTFTINGIGSQGKVLSRGSTWYDPTSTFSGSDVESRPGTGSSRKVRQEVIEIILVKDEGGLDCGGRGECS